jgi:hypothetical protein
MTIDMAACTGAGRQRHDEGRMAVPKLQRKQPVGAPMTLKEAIEVLSQHQKWRKGDDSQPMTDPKELTEALDIAIYLLTVMTKK